VKARRDPKDNQFLELAVSGDAKTIIAENKDITDLKAYQDIEIVKPREFIDREKEKEQSGDSSQARQQTEK